MIEFFIDVDVDVDVDVGVGVKPDEVKGVIVVIGFEIIGGLKGSEGGGSLNAGGIDAVGGRGIGVRTPIG